MTSEERTSATNVEKQGISVPKIWVRSIAPSNSWLVSRGTVAPPPVEELNHGMSEAGIVTGLTRPQIWSFGGVVARAQAPPTPPGNGWNGSLRAGGVQPG